MSTLSKFWNDPVWSKVISAGILTVLTAVGAYIVSLFGVNSFSDVIISILNFNIPLWLAVVVLMFGFIGYGVNRKIIQKRNRKIEVLRYKSPFITFKNQSTDQRYCANCWDKDGSKVQLNADCYDCFECPICKSSGNFSELDDKVTTSHFDSIYRF